MRRNEMTRLDAAHEWKREFNAIQQGMLEPFMYDGSLSEVTVPTIGDRVYAYHCPVEEPYGSITEYDAERDLYTVELDNGKKLSSTTKISRLIEMASSRCGVQCGVSETVAMIGGSKMVTVSELCQSAAFVFTNTRSLDISLALTDVVTIFTRLTGCRFTTSVAYSGTMNWQNIGIRWKEKAIP